MAYQKKTWQVGDVITAFDLNRVEDGIIRIGEEVGALTSDFNNLNIEEILLRSELPGTTVEVTFDANGNPTMITHSANNNTIRTDVFTWGDGTVTEVRTASSKKITITTNLLTLAQTISEIEEVE